VPFHGGHCPGGGNGACRAGNAGPDRAPSGRLRASVGAAGHATPCDPNGRTWRKPPCPAGSVAEAGAGAEAGTSPASGAAADLAPAPDGGPASAPEERPPLLGQAAPALLPLAVPHAVRAWLAPLGPHVATADWPLVIDVFQPAHPQDVNGAHAVWRSFREFVMAAGYDVWPAADRCDNTLSPPHPVGREGEPNSVAG